MIDPVVEVVLLTLARSAPSIFSVIADALKGGDTPEQAIAKAKAVRPKKLDTRAKDRARRERMRKR